MKRFKLFFLFIVISILVFQCTFQKRLYRKGFYIESKYVKQQSPKIKEQEKLISLPLPVLIPFQNGQTFHENNPFILAYQTALKQHIPYFPKNKNKIPLDSCGDKLILKSGEEHKVKVIEISSNEIHYKLCDNLHGPLYVINKSKVLKIVYTNGYTEDIFAYDKASNENIGQTGGKTNAQNKTEPPAFTPALVLTILSLLAGVTFGIGLLLLIPAMFFSRKARRQIHQQPNKYKGKELMGCFMYGALITLSVTVLLLLFLGILSIKYEQDMVMGIIFLSAAFLIGLPVFIFLVTSHKTDYK